MLVKIINSTNGIAEGGQLAMAQAAAFLGERRDLRRNVTDFTVYELYLHTYLAHLSVSVYHNKLEFTILRALCTVQVVELIR